MSSKLRSCKACEPCRQRKEKCDRSLPRCRRCIIGTRVQRKCIYPQQNLDLVLHDQSDAVRTRYERTRKDIDQSRSTDSSGIEISEAKPIISSRRQIVNPSGFVDKLVLQAGSNILLSKFEHGVYHQYLPAIYSACFKSEALQIAIEAVGLRCLSLARNETSLLTRARQYHGMALQTTNRQISFQVCQKPLDPMSELVPYDMVAAALLLGLFTVMTSESQTALVVWTKHVYGALAIVLTSFAQPDVHLGSTPASRNLLGHVVNCVHVSCLQSQVRLPAGLETLYDYLPKDNIQRHLHETIDALARTNSDAKDLPHESFARIEHLYRLDGIIASVLNSLQVSRPFKIITSRDALGHEPIRHQYVSHRDAQIWNLVRILRLKLNEQLLSEFREASGSSLMADQSSVWASLDFQRCWHQSFSTVSMLTFEMYASVPSVLRASANLSIQDVQRATEQNPNQLHWAHSLIWPLTTVQACPYTSEVLLRSVESTLTLLWQATTFPGAAGPEKQQTEGLNIKHWAHIFFWC